MNEETVRVIPVGGHPGTLWLQWEAEVNPDHVPLAFEKLNAALDAAISPLNVLVDLRNDPVLPLTITIHETITGPFRHRNMGKWLVIGKNWRAQVIASVISKTGLRENILWFDTEQEALIRLDELEAQSVNNKRIAVA